MKYCGICKILCYEEACVACGTVEIREVTSDDYCFLLESQTVFAEMLETALAENDIEVAMVPFGNGTRSAFGLDLGNYKIYVPYKHYDEALNVIDELSPDPTERLREELLSNFDSWHVNKKSAFRKISKKLNLPKNEDVFGYIKDIVTNAEKILDDGIISSCTEGGHYIAIIINGKKLWFNSATYEMFV